MLASLILTSTLAVVPTSAASLNTPSLRDGASAPAKVMATVARPLFSGDGYTPEDKMQP